MVLFEEGKSLKENVCSVLRSAISNWVHAQLKKHTESEREMFYGGHTVAAAHYCSIYSSLKDSSPNRFCISQ